DGHTGMTQGDSLGDYSNFEKSIIAECTRETPTIILTNPPFAGTGEGKITQLDVLQRLNVGRNDWRAKQNLNIQMKFSQMACHLKCFFLSDV
ncbi:hypothetical protein, partial [Nostoc sp. 'Peltigera malacea cyanobiont' DB3992]|uniref:hypothetical protein n=1 Tax=Nostoc sp. 'Peltigera malacea cyanobiont' DB3992 TaxID=1206980 RepID=UPI00211F02AE